MNTVNPIPYLQDLLAIDDLPEFKWRNHLKEFQVIPPVMVRTRYGEILIPAGFLSDGMSDPIGRSWGEQGWPAIAHDLLYRLQLDGWTQAMADTVFRDLLLEFGVEPWRAWARWGFLRAVGWIAWNKNKKNVRKLREKYWKGNDYDTNTKRYGESQTPSELRHPPGGGPVDGR